jgi:hypothetical protein
MKKYLILGFLLCGAGVARAQVSIIVNPDGTHSVLHQNGNTGVVVNPNGTHSVIPNTDTNPTVLVNPNGTHSIIQRTGNTATVTGPKGTHTVTGPVVADSTRRPFWYWLVGKRQK